ncbi:MAG TPA: penicillin-binding protein, partial [Roseiflexaceae bacterium]|nr:penicillin-binding protein [Roseiflexaceae bacterium]
GGFPPPPPAPSPPPQTPPGSVPAPPIAAITQPAAGSIISDTQLLVRGSAGGMYQLDLGVGSDPSEWRTLSIGPAMEDGILGVWNLTDQLDGDYTLRLQVTIIGASMIETRTQVQLQRLP